LRDDDVMTDVTYAPGPSVDNTSPFDGIDTTKRTNSDRILESFLRRTSHMTTSTEHSTRSLREILPTRSEFYLRTIRRLVKSFTLPINAEISMSPIPERPGSSWMHDDDAPTSYPGNPYPLPGDFLNPTALFQRPQPCVVGPAQHPSRGYKQFEISDLPTTPLFTAYPNVSWNFSHYGQSLFHGDLSQLHLYASDSFGNTALHFLAAQSRFQVLFHAMQSGVARSIINCQNSAGQTFLHLLQLQPALTEQVLVALLEQALQSGFNMYTQDVYGRSVLHVLGRQGCNLVGLAACLGLDLARCAKRDAFNVLPELPGAQPPTLDMWMDGVGHMPDLMLDPSNDPEVVKETRRIWHMLQVERDPRLEDEDGNNALHNLALVSLSMANVSKKVAPDSLAAFNRLRIPEPLSDDAMDLSDKLDSSTDQMKARLRHLEGLLNLNVDVNHYNSNGNTPLMLFAAQLPEDDDNKTGSEILKLLIARGANIHARNSAGETALHIAVRCGRKLAMRTLVDAGANVHTRDADRRSLLDVADVKLLNSPYEVPKAYAHYEACRAYLSGTKGRAVQNPTTQQEWAMPTSV
jgi:ankyrin repeat protein